MSTLIKLSCSFTVCCMWFIFANYPQEQETIHNKTIEMTQKRKNHCHYLCIEKCFRECFCFLNIGRLLPFFFHFYLWFCAHIHKHTSSHTHVHTPHLSLFSFAYLLSLPTYKTEKIAASTLQASLYHSVINMNLLSTSTVQRRKENFGFSERTTNVYLNTLHISLLKCYCWGRLCSALWFSKLSQSLRWYICEHC